MSEMNTPEGMELTLRTLAMPADTNAAGDIFGGWVMSQMDLAAAVRADERAKGRTATVAVHVDALKPGSRVLLIDDLLATGGTAAAAAALVKRLGAEILEIAFLIELSFLAGREKLKEYPIRSLVAY